jgi:rhodanese-related sulfurtransferase
MDADEIMNVIKRYAFFSFVAFLAVLPGCWSGSSTQEKTKIKGLVVINVLDKAEYDDCHIRGSMNVPFVQIKEYAQDSLEKDADIVLYCSNYMCSSSGFARKQLIELGFQHVTVYEGGTAEWFQKGYPVDGPALQPYLQKVMQAPPAQPYVIDAVELKKKIDARDAR